MPFPPPVCCSLPRHLLLQPVCAARAVLLRHESKTTDKTKDIRAMQTKTRNKICVIALSALLLCAAAAFEHSLSLPLWQLLLIYLVPYLLAGHGVLREAGENLLEGEPFDEDFLMAVATLGALAIGFLPGAEKQFAEAVAVMLFFQVGELFEDYAEGKSRRSISALMDIRPDTAGLLLADGTVKQVAAESVQPGQEIVVRPGERVPLDGVVAEGESALDTSALTGESVPRAVRAGELALSGCVNLSSPLRLRVEKAYGESTASKVIELVEHASARKSRNEAFITRFARIYTPAVVSAAVLLALLPPLFANSFAGAFPIWLCRALTFLVVSCPCALVISVPLTYFGGIGGASRCGILVKGGCFLDALAAADTVVFDKTGTLTHGRFSVVAVHPDDCPPEHLLHLAAHVESLSTHPVALSLVAAWDGGRDGCSVESVEEVAGKGVRAVVNGRRVCVGNERMMEAEGARWRPCHKAGTTVHVCIDGAYAGHIVVSDTVKPDAALAVSSLHEAGVRRTVMLTGDNAAAAEAVAKETGVDEWHAGLLPAGKVEKVESMLEGRTGGGTLVFVGDGINDAPVLARADVGVAMGGLGSDAAIEAADVVLMDDSPSKVALAVQIARRTRDIATQNVWFAIGVKVLVLALAAFGAATMWMAVFADVGVTVLAVTNAMRALRVPGRWKKRTAAA